MRDSVTQEEAHYLKGGNAMSQDKPTSSDNPMTPADSLPDERDFEKELKRLGISPGFRFRCRANTPLCLLPKPTHHHGSPCLARS